MEALQHLFINDEQTPTATTFRHLGVEQAVGVPKAYCIPKACVDRPIQLAKRVERLPHHSEKKLELLAMSACAAGIFGAEMGLMSAEDEARVLAVVTRVLWGQARQAQVHGYPVYGGFQGPSCASSDDDAK